MDPERDKFCVDMPDVAGCKLVSEATGEDASVPSPATEDAAARNMLRLEIVFSRSFRNRFLFNRATGTEDAAAAPMQHTVSLTGTTPSLRAAFKALREAVLRHEETAKQEREQRRTARRNRAETGASGAQSYFAAKAAAATLPSSTGASPSPTPPLSVGGARDLEAKGDAMPQLEIVVQGKSEIVSDADLRAILSHVPTRHQLDEWALRFNMSVDGTYLLTLMEKLADCECSLLILSDADRKVFGGFASETWRRNPRYYGSGESFVFELAPEPRVYHWTGKNSYFQLCDGDSIAMGGGDHFAFHVDKRLEHGTSGPCPTYGSPQLASAPDFIVYRMEAWGPLAHH